MKYCLCIMYLNKRRKIMKNSLVQSSIKLSLNNLVYVLYLQCFYRRMTLNTKS